MTDLSNIITVQVRSTCTVVRGADKFQISLQSRSSKLLVSRPSSEGKNRNRIKCAPNLADIQYDMGGDKNVSKFPTELLSSFVDLICSQCNDETKVAIHDELEILKSTISRIGQQINDHEERQDKDAIDFEHNNARSGDQFAMPPPPDAPSNKIPISTDLLTPSLEEDPREDSKMYESQESDSSRDEEDCNDQTKQPSFADPIDATDDPSSPEDDNELDESNGKESFVTNPLHEEPGKTRKKGRKLSQHFLSPMVSFKDDEVSSRIFKELFAALYFKNQLYC